MRAVVRERFTAFNAPIEGVVPFMYLDVKGLVTTAIGVLIDPIQYAMPLPWNTPDGKPAARDQIAAEWLRVKARKDLAPQGGMAFQRIAALRLSPLGIEMVVSRKLTQMDQHLAARFDRYEELCADCQLGLLSMAWACGAAFRFPVFESFIRARSFALATQECRIDEEGNPGVRPRNIANKVLFMNAHCVARDGLDPDKLYYPESLEDRINTQRELPSLVEPEDAEEQTKHSVIPKSDGIFQAVADATAQYQKKKDEEG